MDMCEAGCPLDPLFAPWLSFSSTCKEQLHIFISFFLFLFLFWKTPRLPQRGFHSRCLPLVPQGRFSPRDLLILFSFFSSLGHLTRFSTQRWDSGTSWRFSPESLFFFIFSFFSGLMREELELAPPSSLFYWYCQQTLALIKASCTFSISVH